MVHVHGGYMVGTYITTKYVFDLKEDDVYFCVADPGWVTGHSYIVYGPLLNGATILTAEGKPDYPNPGRWWDLIERYGVSIFYTTPTAIRLLMRYGEDWPKKYDLSTLRILGSVGEPINPEAWEWFHRAAGGDKPIMDTWWQTETGSILITPLPSVPLKPGSATRPFLGIEADVVDSQGNSLPANAGGLAVIRKPWPSMMRTIYKDPERYKTYWNTIPNCYTAGDICHKDEDGYMWFMGRADDVIKVAGNRLGTAEVESALVSHHAVAEAAVIGKPHKLVGESIKAFVILKQGEVDSPALIQSIKDQVMKELGKIAVPSEIDIVPSLPKTRSGKIMRRVLKAKELGQDLGDISTIEDWPTAGVARVSPTPNAKPQSCRFLPRRGFRRQRAFAARGCWPTWRSKSKRSRTPFTCLRSRFAPKNGQPDGLCTGRERPFLGASRETHQTERIDDGAGIGRRAGRVGRALGSDHQQV